MKAGDTFFAPDAFGTHLNVILAILPGGSIVHCHITKIYGRGRHDPACVIHPGEHPFIKFDSYALFGQAVLCEAGMQLDALERQISGQAEPVSPQLLTRLIQGALSSINTPDKIKAVLAKNPARG